MELGFCSICKLASVNLSLIVYGLIDKFKRLANFVHQAVSMTQKITSQFFEREINLSAFVTEAFYLRPKCN